MSHAETWRGMFRTDYPQKVHNLVDNNVQKKKHAAKYTGKIPK